MRRLLLLIALLIGYGSLYPLDFTAAPQWRRQALELFTAPDWHMSRGDLVGNVLLFMPYGLVALLLAQEGGGPAPRARRLALLLALGCALALGLQIAQLWVPSRVAALNDVLANVAGLLLGLGAGVAMRRWWAPPGAAGTALAPTLVPALLALLWLGYQWFPLVPTLDRQNMLNALKPLLLAPRLDLARTLHTGLSWLAFFALCDAAFARPIRTLTLICVALSSVGAKVFIVSAQISPANLAGLALALAALPWRTHPASRPLLGLAMLASLFVSGWTPFIPLLQPQPFHWVPFAAMLEGSMVVNGLNLLEKTFFYGALIALLRGRSSSPWGAALLLALCLSVIEAVQIYLPGHTPESTDPLLALCLAFAMGLQTPSPARPPAPPPP